MMKSNTVILIIVAVALLAGAFFVLKSPSKTSAPAVAVIEEAPRTETPMDEYTRFFTKKQFEIDDGKQKRGLTYYWFEPQGKPYPAGLKFPLVVVLHGAPGKAYAAKYLISQKMQIDYPAFIVVPQSPAAKKWAMPEKFSGQEFGGGKTANYVYHPELESLPDTITLIKQLQAQYPIDQRRIYFAGCSDGGTGVYGAALRYPDVFAAGTVISGVWSFLDAPKLKTAPLWIMHGTQDAIFPVNVARGMAQLGKQHAAPTFYTEFPSMGHECSEPSLYSKALWQWLFGQKKRP